MIKIKVIYIIITIIKMTTYTEQIKELCEANSIDYVIRDNIVLIDNEKKFIRLLFLIK